MSMENQVVTVKLETPFEYEDKTYEEIVMDLGKLTGKDAMAIEEELAAVNHTVTYPLADGEYIRMVAARASSIAEDVFTAMPIRHYVAILQAVRMFLVRPKANAEEVTLKLEELTGADYQAIEAELEAERYMVMMPSQDRKFLQKMAVRAGSINEKELKEMPLRDYNDLLNRVRNFLTKSASGKSKA